ncbi:MAG TPA: arginine--tRNA ligase [Gemmatimonadales bacterium]|nr:arginine--tRNA ligase [Gemmatimonadales bacterium]
MTQHERLAAALRRAALKIGVSEVPAFKLETPRDPAHGDVATNLALVLAPLLRLKPREVAERLVAALDLSSADLKKVEIAGPGFINFFLGEAQLAAVIRDIVAAGDRYGRSEAGQGRRVNIEFVSANPTGPLHVGHGRGAALGDGIASLLEWTGHVVTREFYVNDAGTQIEKLAQSLWARLHGTEPPEGGYHGQYLVEMAQQAKDAHPEWLKGPYEGWATALRAYATKAVHAQQEEDLSQFHVKFDEWRSEQALYDSGKVQATLDLLAKQGLTFEQDGALWLRTSAFGDDKDRVLRKQDGTLTYLAPDIAYHIDKRDRKHDVLIDVWGADHHGYIARMRAALRALGCPDSFFNVVLVQLVKVVRGGEEVKMSKRSGEFVTLRDLYDEVGVDAARYFFLMRRGDSQFVFDVDLAKSQTEENPVFYVQMAHARMSGIFRVAARTPESVAVEGVDLAALTAPEEVDLLKELGAFPGVVARAAETYEPHRITSFLEGLARLAHAWYHKYRVLGEPQEAPRLALARAARQVFRNGLSLLGIQAPDRM